MTSMKNHYKKPVIDTEREQTIYYLIEQMIQGNEGIFEREMALQNSYVEHVKRINFEFAAIKDCIIKKQIAMRLLLDKNLYDNFDYLHKSTYNRKVVEKFRLFDLQEIISS